MGPIGKVGLGPRPTLPRPPSGRGPLFCPAPPLPSPPLVCSPDLTTGSGPIDTSVSRQGRLRPERVPTHFRTSLPGNLHTARARDPPVPSPLPSQDRGECPEASPTLPREPSGTTKRTQNPGPQSTRGRPANHRDSVSSWQMCAELERKKRPPPAEDGWKLAICHSVEFPLIGDAPLREGGRAAGPPAPSPGSTAVRRRTPEPGVHTTEAGARGALPPLTDESPG